MVGGKVIEVLEYRAGVLWINCEDSKHTCAVCVEDGDVARQIEVGDKLWWQGSRAFWTPNANAVSEEVAIKNGLQIGSDYDVPVVRVGGSGVNRPTKAGSAK